MRCIFCGAAADWPDLPSPLGKDYPAAAFQRRSNPVSCIGKSVKPLRAGAFGGQQNPRPQPVQLEAELLLN